MNGPTMPTKMSTGSDADQPAPVGHDEVRRDVEDRRPELVERVDQGHIGILAARRQSRPDERGAFAGCPSSRSRRGPASSRPASRVAVLGRCRRHGPRLRRRLRRLRLADRRRRPAPARSSRPRSQSAPAVRAPRGVEEARQLAVVGDDEDRGGRGRPVRLRVSSTSDRSTASAVRGRRNSGRESPGRDPLVAQPALGRPVEDELDRDRRRDRAAQPPDERRPAGAAPAARDIA